MLPGEKHEICLLSCCLLSICTTPAEGTINFPQRPSHYSVGVSFFTLDSFLVPIYAEMIWYESDGGEDPRGCIFLLTYVLYPCLLFIWLFHGKRQALVVDDQCSW